MRWVKVKPQGPDRYTGTRLEVLMPGTYRADEFDARQLPLHHLRISSMRA
ncbi:MAG TPA: hypothetical protein VEA40_00505 [Ramlibacter sp.]|nr:hypothetical protein [Ramlibacter sp.]